jgi:class 3 adenylate cyclase
MQHIADWLKNLGMSEYAQRFAENDIDFAVLPDLTDQDLEKIGVASLGHRRKLLRAIADLEAEKRAPAVASATTARAEMPALDTAERSDEPGSGRQITVMFADLVGSTTLSARMDPEDLREVTSQPTKSALPRRSSASAAS